MEKETEKKVNCHQCKNCAVENTAVLACADDDCKCHVYSQKENNWDYKFNYLVGQLNGSQTDVVIATELKELITQAIQEERSRTEKYLTDVEATYNTEKTQDYKAIVTEIKRYLSVPVSNR